MMKQYQFYEMMGYTAPYQKEFFGYFDTEKELLGGEPMHLSWAKATSGLEKVHTELASTGWIWKYIPFVEMVYLTGKHSFNEDDDAIGWWIITSTKRMWSTYFLLSVVLKVCNWRRKRKGKLPRRIDVLQEDTGLGVEAIKEGAFDVLPIYQLAHVSLYYKKYEAFAWSLFEENVWIKEYLPNFPQQHVIGLGIEHLVGGSSFAKTLESLFANVVGDMLQYLAKQCMLCVFMFGKLFRTTDVRILEGLIWRDTWRKAEIMLTWKVLRKKTTL